MIKKLQEYCSRKRTAREISISEIELNNVDLKSLQADGLGFVNVVMSRVDFEGAEWRNCSIDDSTLNYVNFSHATLRLCSWNNVRTQHCDFSFMVFENSDAAGCLFDGANFESASLVDSDFSRASLRNANLSNADVMGINLRGADLRGANCDGVSFLDADLRGADFSGAKMDRAELQNADVRGTIFDESVETVEEAEEFTPMFSPANQALADAIGPLVVSLLKNGADRDLFSKETEEKFMQDLEGVVHMQEDTDSVQQGYYDKIIGTLLSRAGNVGISELINALHEDKEQPPEAIEKMLKGLSKDMQLDENATTEELLEKILKSFR